MSQCVHCGKKDKIENNICINCHKEQPEKKNLRQDEKEAEEF